MESLGSSPGLTPQDVTESHAPLVRLALWIAVVSAVALGGLWLITGITALLVLVSTAATWAATAFLMIRVGRENAPVMLSIAAVQVALGAYLIEARAVASLASPAFVFIGVALAIFVKRNLIPFLVAYSVLLGAANFLWLADPREAAGVGTISVIAFITGSLGLSWIRDRSMDSASRFLNLFERAPVSLWEEDFSKVGVWLEELRQQGVTELRPYLEANPDVLRHGMSLIEVVRVNRAAARFLEASDPSDLVGPLKPETFPEDALPSMAAQFQAVWDGVFHITTEVRRGFTTQGHHLDGLLHWAVPARFGLPDLSRVIVSVVDVTAIYDARRDLEASLKSKDELIATVSHELRTPLTTVVGLSTELSESYADFSREEAQGLLNMISDQSLEVANIVEDLLVAARAESGSLLVSVEPVDLHVEVKATLRGLELEGEVDCHVMGVVDFVLADSGRARQIMRNLLVNAERYGAAPIRMIVRNDGKMVKVEIRDGGEPIPLEERELVFERYYRARQTPGITASVGLGLTVSRELVRIMGGDLTYDHDGESVFTLSLPRKETQATRCQP